MANELGNAMGGAMTGASIGSIIPGVGTAIGAGIGGLLGLLNSGGGKNPLEDFMKEQTYKYMEQNFYNKFLSTLNKSTATTSSLLANSMSKTGSYSGSSYVANKQRQDIESKNRQTAQEGATDFAGRLYGTGMNIFAEGALEQYKNKTSFGNELMTLGGGVLARKFAGNNNQFGTSAGNAFMQQFGGGKRYNYDNISPSGIMDDNSIISGDSWF
jgi:hypothetical protein